MKIIISIFIIFNVFVNCSFYSELGEKKEEEKLKDDLLALVEAQKTLDSISGGFDSLFGETGWFSIVNGSLSYDATVMDTPDTTGTPNPANTYPGNAPDPASIATGSCFMETDDTLGTGRDMCCYEIADRECAMLSDGFFNNGNYTPTFNADSASTQQSCLDTGFLYCNTLLKCCYN